MLMLCTVMGKIILNIDDILVLLTSSYPIAEFLSKLNISVTSV